MTRPGQEEDAAVELTRLPRVLSPAQAGRAALLGATTTSYGELAAMVDALAAELLTWSDAIGDRVAVWTEKQPRYVAAVLASLQAGCGYVPLDGGQPASRVRGILQDAEPVVLVTDSRRLAALGEASLPAGIRAVVLVDDPPGPTSPPSRPWPAPGAGSSPARRAVTADDLAAILYTSGSTGSPKGVQISYRNLAAFVGWARDELDVGPDDVFANHASFNFDLSTFDLFVALSVGAAVWVVEDGCARDPGALADGISRHGVTVWYSVPSVLDLLIASGALTPATAAGLRYVVFAGEVFPMPQLRALAERLPDQAVLYNFYGPTETNVCTYHRVTAADLTADEPLPIGVPVPGARVAVVDETGRPVRAVDDVGELVVEGPCVTPGYWRRGAESLAAGHPSGRHRTGDLVTCRDGRLVYRGRLDRLVKLSGYRVELDEVEAVVLRHPAVAAAAVVVTGDGAAARLAVHYTLRDGARRPSLLELKRHCAELLPRYMVPHRATCVEELPRTANGKKDYLRLRATALQPTTTKGDRP